MTNKRMIPRDLECGHRLWFRQGFLPRKNDRLWCKSCREYVRTLNSAATDGHTLWAGGYTTTPSSHGFTVACNYETDCEWTIEARSYADAETQAFRHMARDHGKSSLLSTHTIERKPIPNEPDF